MAWHRHSLAIERPQLVVPSFTRMRRRPFWDDGSHQADLWGINLYPADYGAEAWIEFDSMINVRPSKGNRSRSVDDTALRERIIAVVSALVRP
jgi:hypothetical protein